MRGRAGLETGIRAGVWGRGGAGVAAGRQGQSLDCRRVIIGEAQTLAGWSPVVLQMAAVIRLAAPFAPCAIGLDGSCSGRGDLGPRLAGEHRGVVDRRLDQVLVAEVDERVAAGVDVGLVGLPDLLLLRRGLLQRGPGHGLVLDRGEDQVLAGVRLTCRTSAWPCWGTRRSARSGCRAAARACRTGSAPRPWTSAGRRSTGRTRRRCTASPACRWLVSAAPVIAEIGGGL